MRELRENAGVLGDADFQTGFGRDTRDTRDTRDARDARDARDRMVTASDFA